MKLGEIEITRDQTLAPIKLRCDVWKLSVDVDNNQRVILEIKHDYANDDFVDRYRAFLQNDLAEDIIIRSPSEMWTHFDEICDHEGDDAGREWLSSYKCDTRYVAVRDELIKRWEAFVALGIFRPSITM
jgi:hypothetical protein